MCTTPPAPHGNFVNVAELSAITVPHSPSKRAHVPPLCLLFLPAKKMQSCHKDALMFCSPAMRARGDLSGVLKDFFSFPLLQCRRSCLKSKLFETVSGRPSLRLHFLDLHSFMLHWWKGKISSHVRRGHTSASPGEKGLCCQVCLH